MDVGGANAANQEELHSCLKLLFPMTANTMHTRVNTRWDLATAMRYLEGELGYKGLYTIRGEQRPRGHACDLRRRHRHTRRENLEKYAGSEDPA